MLTDLSAERVRELLHYDPDTGLFTRAAGKARGRVTGTPTCDGRLQIKLDGRAYMAHRLAFLYMTGNWPTKLIDHRNGITNDNAWSNLREATPAENNRNRRGIGAVPFKGVSWNKRDKRYQTGIRCGGKKIALGTFRTAEEAHAAYAAAAMRLHGEFARVA